MKPLGNFKSNTIQRNDPLASHFNEGNFLFFCGLSPSSTIHTLSTTILYTSTSHFPGFYRRYSCSTSCLTKKIFVHKFPQTLLQNRSVAICIFTRVDFFLIMLEALNHFLKLARVSLRQYCLLQRQQNNAIDMVAIHFHLVGKSIFT